jgi:Predicted phosphatase homologous to the C-terminal domain of histone macroH2A1
VLELKFTKNNIAIDVKLGDITEFNGDAIVNPANTLMIMGGGVAGAIKRKGGEIIELEAKKHAPVPIGEAVVTTAGNLKCRYVIHAPTVKYPGSRSSFEQVYEATKAALLKAKQHGLKSVAFPLMGAGVGGLKIEESVDAMIKAFEEEGEGLDLKIIVRDKEAYSELVKYLESKGLMTS